MKIEIGDTVPLKVAILFGLETFIKDKLVAAGTPAGVVEWGRESFGQDEATQRIISFIEPPKPADITPPPDKARVRNYEWTIFIQGILPDTLERPTAAAYDLVVTVKSALFELNETNQSMGATNNLLNLGPNAQKSRGNFNNLHKLNVGAETVRGPGDHSRYTFFWLPLHLGIVEDLKSPRVQVQDPL